MKRTLPFVFAICMTCVGCGASDPNESSDEELTYLGLEIPGSVPEVFAPGLVSTFRERTANGWSDLKSLGAAFDKFEIMRLTASRDGTYVFDERKEAGLLRYSRLVDGQREAPVAFGREINQGTFTAHPFIAEDESYLIFDSKREEGFGDSDLYISFSDNDGNWGPAINLGSEINTEFEDIFGSVTADGEFFIYSTINLEAPSANIYWIDAAFIDALRPKIEDGTHSGEDR